MTQSKQNTKWREKTTRIPISKEDYQKLCDIAIEKGKSVEDTLMDLLEIAGEYDITKIKKNEKTKHRIYK